MKTIAAVEYEMFKLPTKTTIAVEYNNQERRKEAKFLWNGGELDSKEDFEIPMVGYGATDDEAIGNLIIKYNQKTKST